jgi:hypothetical protein
MVLQIRAKVKWKLESVLQCPFLMQIVIASYSIYQQRIDLPHIVIPRSVVYHRKVAAFPEVFTSLKPVCLNNFVFTGKIFSKWT